MTMAIMQTAHRGNDDDDHSNDGDDDHSDDGDNLSMTVATVDCGCKVNIVIRLKQHWLQ